MNTPENDIKKIVSFINNKKRKEFNKWKIDRFWVYDDDTDKVNDCDILYWLYHDAGTPEPQRILFMDLIDYIDPEDPFNSRVKWASPWKKQKFLSQISTLGFLF